ncbi:MAG: dockerin type I repeat-containing protein [Candidatus Zixiibacteriota bacterium]
MFVKKRVVIAIVAALLMVAISALAIGKAVPVVEKIPFGVIHSGVSTAPNLPAKGPYNGPRYKPDDNLLRQGGDQIGDATPIPGLPFVMGGTTVGYVDDYDEICPYNEPGSPDVVYVYTEPLNVTVDITLCNGSTYDTKLYLYENVYTPGAPYACNDDACPGYVSALWGLSLMGGNSYYIVIDGYGGDAGDYLIEMYEHVECILECPPGATDEGEPCGDDMNGGCGSDPVVFRPINCGETVCGTIWADADFRDTDWYQLFLESDATIIFTGVAEQPLQIGYVTGCPMGAPECTCVLGLEPYAQSAPCEEASIQMDLTAGEHWLWVGSQLFDGYPCGTSNDYIITLMCEGDILPPYTVITHPSDTAWWNDHPYFSESVMVEAIDYLNESVIQYTTFDIYNEGIWQPFGIDYDGSDYMKDDYDSASSGDGWSATLVAAQMDPPLTEGYYSVRATMTAINGLVTSDTITVYYDPFPPVPTIFYPEVFNYVTSPPVEIMFTTQADNVAEMVVTVLPVPQGYEAPIKRPRGPLDCFQGYNKGIPSFNQNDLYPDADNGSNYGCYPTAVAACLKYWAGNGFPGLDGNGTMTDGQMVNEVADSMGTNRNSGTNDANAKAGTLKYIEGKLGPCKFKVEHVTGNDVTLKRYLKEMFENDEDVIPSDHHHVVTANSFCVHPQFYVDFMDPATGSEVQTTDWGKGFDGHKLTDMLVISPKEDSTVEIPDSVGWPTEDPPGSGTYGYEWDPDPTEYPPGYAYLVEVVIIDELGHVGWDMVKIEFPFDYLIGDCDGSGAVDIDDVVYVIQYIFAGGPPPDPIESGDVDCSGAIDIDDVVYLIQYIFGGGPPPGDPNNDGIPDC